MGSCQGFSQGQSPILFHMYMKNVISNIYIIIDHSGVLMGLIATNNTDIAASVQESLSSSGENLNVLLGLTTY